VLFSRFGKPSVCEPSLEPGSPPLSRSNHTVGFDLPCIVLTVAKRLKLHERANPTGERSGVSQTQPCENATAEASSSMRGATLYATSNQHITLRLIDRTQSGAGSLSTLRRNQSSHSELTCLSQTRGGPYGPGHVKSCVANKSKEKSFLPGRPHTSPVWQLNPVTRIMTGH
jgi:hypothetical protein